MYEKHTDTAHIHLMFSIVVSIWKKNLLFCIPRNKCIFFLNIMSWLKIWAGHSEFFVCFKIVLVNSKYGRATMNFFFLVLTLTVVVNSKYGQATLNFVCFNIVIVNQF